jgi:hypothetical protein
MFGILFLLMASIRIFDLCTLLLYRFLRPVGRITRLQIITFIRFSLYSVSLIFFSEKVIQVILR